MIEEQAHSSSAENIGVVRLRQAEHAIAQGLHASVLTILDDRAVADIEALAQPDSLLRLAHVFHQSIRSSI